uniref:Aminotransferase class I/classII large domain-containing protein n=1 Tax=Lotharella globosa TaxID=91324 RepID=A0A7S3ZEB0_9EUKA
MDYSSYEHRLGHRMPMVVGHTAWSTVQWTRMVGSGSLKVMWNRVNGIPEWRMHDEDGEKHRLPKLFNNSKGTYIRLCYATVEDIFNRPIASEPNDWIDCIIREFDRSQKGFNPRLLLTDKTKRCLNLSSYNYLGFGGVNKFATPKVADAIRKYPVVNDSPAAEFGCTSIHREAERVVASFLGKEDAVIMGMGFATNSTVLPALVGKGDLIISDALNHTSIVQGARESGAKIKVFAHNDPMDLERVLQEAVLSAKFRKILLCIEGIYSMEGDLCRLAEIVKIAKKFGAYVYLDEAHSIGAIGKSGRGVSEELGVDVKNIDIMMGTFTKSFGSTGGYIAADRHVVEHVRRHAAGYTDSLPIPPACAVQIIEALRVISGEDGTDIGQRKLKAIRENSDFFRTGLEKLGFEILGERPSPIIPVMLYGPYKIGDFSRLCFQRGLAVVSVGAPAVPVYQSRARFCISAAHKRKDLEWALQVVSEVGDVIGLKYRGNSRPLPMMPGTLASEEASHVARQRKTKELVESRRLAVDEALRRMSFAPLVEKTVKPCLQSNNEDNEEVMGEEMKGDTKERIIDAMCDAKICLSSWDLYGMGTSPIVKAECLSTVEKKGCGSCGPRGFYGTFPEHLDAEKDIADFLGVDQCMLYSYGACTTSSVVACMASKDDVLIVDEGINRNILTGLNLTRAEIVYYRHCDMEDCEAKINALIEEDNRTIGKTPRKRFLVTEAIFSNTGRIARVDKLATFRIKYQCRLILDESFSFGVLGATGRGATEHFGIPVSAVDVICGSLEAVGASCCGFAAGSQGVMGCQRLLGSGYCFSASCPPYLATSVSAAIRVIKKDSSVIHALRAKTASLRSALARIPALITPSSPASPLIPLFLAETLGDKEDDSRKLDLIAQYCVKKGVRVCRQVQNPLGRAAKFMAPSLRVYASAAVPNDAAGYIAKVLNDAVVEVLGITATSEAESSTCEFTRSPKYISRTGSESSLAPSMTNSPTSASGGDSESPKKNRGMEMDEAEDFLSMSTPVLMLFGVLLSLYRRFLLREDTVTRRLTKGWLSLMPSRDSPAMRLFYNVAKSLGSHTFYQTACPTLVWAFDSNPYASLVLVLYCVGSVTGWMIKSMVSAGHSVKDNRNAAYSKGHKVYAWPSVASMNAIVLPFFMMRWLYGDMWLYHRFGLMSLLTVLSAIMWVLTVVLGRLDDGDSPTNIQGGIFFGALAIHGWLRYAGPTLAWFEGRSYSLWCPPFVLTLLVLTLTPLPTSKGSVVGLARIYYVRAAELLSFMCAFMVGAMLDPRAHPLPRPTVASMVLRGSLGLMLYILSHRVLEKIASTLVATLVTFVTTLCPCLQHGAGQAYRVGSGIATKAAQGFIVSAVIPQALRALC